MSRGLGFSSEGRGGRGSFMRASSSYSIRSSGSMSSDIRVMARGGAGGDTNWVGDGGGRGWVEGEVLLGRGVGASSWVDGVGLSFVEWV